MKRIFKLVEKYFFIIILIAVVIAVIIPNSFNKYHFRCPHFYKYRIF